MGNSLHARETFPGPDVGLDFLTRSGISKTSPYFKRYRRHFSLHGSMCTYLLLMFVCIKMSRVWFFIFFFWGRVGVGEGVTLGPEFGDSYMRGK